jgi:hypothetical protein
MDYFVRVWNEEMEQQHQIYKFIQNDKEASRARYERVLNAARWRLLNGFYGDWYGRDLPMWIVREGTRDV